MNARKMGWVVVPALLLGVGCATPGKRTAIGGAAGAIVGAGVGGAVGRDWEGAAIGAGAGAVAGAAVGNYLDKQARELEQVAETHRTDHGILLNLRSELLFETDSAVLTDEAITRLSRIGDILAKYPEDKLRIEGHTDSQGADAFNLDLSQRRANNVRKRLIEEEGIAAERLEAVGYGETRPVDTNNTAAGRENNRRVEFTILEMENEAP